MNIRQKLIIILAGVVLLTSALGFYAYFQEIEHEKEEVIADAESSAKTTAFSITYQNDDLMGVRPLYKIPLLLQEYINNLHEFKKIDIVVVDNNKKIIADAIPENTGKTFGHDTENEVGKTLRDGITRTFIEKSEDYPEGIRQIVVPLINESGITVGALVMDYTSFYDQLLSRHEKTAENLAISTIIIMFIVSVFGYYAVSKITVPIEKLKNAAVEISGGNLDAKVGISSKDEIGQLALTFNQMAQSLQQGGRELRESEERYRTIVDNSSEAIWTLDIDGNVMFFNSGTEKISGYKLEDWKGKSFAPLIVKEDLSKVIDVFQKTLNGKPQQYEASFIAKNGKIITIEGNSAPIYSKGEIAGTVTIGKDITERKQMMDVLRESEEKYRKLVELTKTGFLILDHRGTVIDANNEYVRLTGHQTLAEIAGKSVIEWTAEYEKEKNARAVEECVRDGYVNNLEIDYVDDQGRITPVEINAFVEGQGETLRIISLCRDITERRKSEEVLRESEERYRTLVELSSDAIYTLDTQGNFTFANKRAEEISGYKLSELLGKNFAPLILPSDLPKVKEIFLDTLQRKRHDDEVNVIRKDGTTEVISVSTTPEIKAGKVVGTVSFARDITEHKQMLDALHESEERFRGVVQHANEAIIINDALGIITFWNKHAQDIFGYTSDEIMGKSASVIMSGKLREAFEEIPDKTKSSFIGNRFEWIGLHKNGSEFPIEISLFSWKTEKAVFNTAIINDISERKRIEWELEEHREHLEKLVNERTKALQESEELFRSMAENIREVFWISPPDYQRIDYISPAFEDIWGRKTSELYQNPTLWLDLILPEDKDMVLSALEQVAQGEPYRIEYRILRPDGTMRWVEDRGYPVKDKIGKVLRTMGVARDITERKKAEEELRSIRDRLNYLLTSSPAVIYSSGVSEDFGVTYISENITTLLGYKPSDFIENSSFWVSHLHPDDKERVLSDLKHLFVSGNCILEYRFLHKDGNYRWMRDEGRLIRDEHDQPREIIGYWLDITGRRHAEEAQVRIANIVENSTDFVSIADFDGRLSYINPAGRKMLGMPLNEDLSNLYIPYFFTEGTHDVLMNEAIPVALQKGAWSGETILKSMEGKEIPVSQVLIAYKDASDNIEFFFTIARDITERKRAEQELLLSRDEALRASAVKSEFLSKMSHELRTPLNAVMGFSEILRAKGAGDLNEKQERYVNNIYNSGKHLLGIISDMLDLVKVESGEQLPLSMESFHVAGAIENTLIFVNEKAVQKNIVIKKEINPGLDVISADKLRFKQILLNLLENAIKFSKPEGGTITIKAGKADGMAQFSVSDTGIGIREEDMEKLFELFHQVDSGTSRRYGGTGLGLAITKQLVEQHGGRIWVESKYGEGTTFFFTLPLEMKK